MPVFVETGAINNVSKELKMNCKIPGCKGQGSRYGRLCNSHKSRARRHGHPLQEGVTKQELKPYLEAVRRRFEARPENNAMAGTKQRLYGLVDNSKVTVAAYYRGQPTHRNQLIAAQEILKVSEAVPAEAVIETVLAMYLLADADSHRFRSDEAFLFQVSRRVRALTNMNVGTYYDPQSSQVKRVYRDLTPKSSRQLGLVLIETLGVAGLIIANLEREEQKARHKADEEYYKALLSLGS